MQSHILKYKNVSMPVWVIRSHKIPGITAWNFVTKQYEIGETARAYSNSNLTMRLNEQFESLKASFPPRVLAR